MNGFTLHHGDCLQIMREMPANSVDCIIADIPSGVTNCEWDSPLDIDKMWNCVNHVRKTNTPVLLFAEQPLASQLIMSNLKMFRYDIVVEKTHQTGYLNANKMPLRAHEIIYVFYERLPTYNPQKTNGHKLKISKSKRNGQTSTVYGNESAEVSYNSAERFPRSVLKFSWDKQKSTYHPSQKPISLMRYLIRTFSSKGDTVLDFAMGSGSCGVGAVLEGRGFVGVEMNMEIFNIAEMRISNASGKIVLTDKETAAGMRSLFD